MSLLSTFTATKMAHRAHASPANTAATQRACRAGRPRGGRRSPVGTGLSDISDEVAAQRGVCCRRASRGPGGKAPSQKQMIRFSSSKTLASSGFIKFPFRLSEENKGRK